MRKRAGVVGALVIVGAAVVVVLFVQRPRPLPDPPAAPSDAMADPAIAEAIAQALQTTRGASDDPAARAELAMVYHANGLRPLAAVAYAQALSRDPKQPRWWYHLGRARAEEGDYVGAVVAFDRVIALDPSYAPAWWRRGQSQLEQGDLGAAKASFAEATRRAPDDHAPSVGLARVALIEDEAATAVSILEPVIAARPDDAYLHQLLGNALQQSGRLREAAPHLARAQGRRPVFSDPWRDEVAARRVGYLAVFEEADALDARGDHAIAILKLESLLARHPDDALLVAKIGEMHLAAGDPSAAIDRLEEAAEIDPDAFQVNLLLGTVFMQSGQHDRALRHVNRAVELHPTLAATHRLRGDVLSQQSRWTDAAQAYVTALRYGDRSTMTQVNLASVRYQQDDLAGARQVLVQVTAQDPTQLRALLLLALVEGRLRDFSAANGYLQRAAALKPQDPAVRETADLLRRMRDGGAP